jgi:hypothetical protein
MSKGDKQSRERMAPHLLAGTFCDEAIAVAKVVEVFERLAASESNYRICRSASAPSPTAVTSRLSSNTVHETTGSADDSDVVMLHSTIFTSPSRYFYPTSHQLGSQGCAAPHKATRIYQISGNDRDHDLFQVVPHWYLNNVLKPIDLRVCSILYNELSGDYREH